MRIEALKAIIIKGWPPMSGASRHCRELPEMQFQLNLKPEKIKL